MKSKIEHRIKKYCFFESNSPEIYLADYTNVNKSGACLLENKPDDINCIFINNKSCLNVQLVAFGYNALELSIGHYSKQCEGVLFPTVFDENNWVLFFETKYSNDLFSAFKVENDYPNCMVDQIICSVNYFRTNGIINPEKRVYAIVSFPNLLCEFSSTFFTGELSVIEILSKHKILIRATNTGEIISSKRIKI